jgi:septum formation protein
VAHFILASGSPRRRDLLSEAGYRFEVVSPSVEEVSHDWLTIREVTTWNAARKAASVSVAAPDAVVLAADTLVTIDGEVLGKPADFEQALEMLRRLSGRSHEVWTAVRISHASKGKSESFQELSRVYFRALNESAIRGYLTKIDPLDKAGAYAAQGYGREIIERIDGSYTNVVGLPMERTQEALRAFGVMPANSTRRSSR